jgi:cysteine desulfurase
LAIGGNTRAGLPASATAAHDALMSESSLTEQNDRPPSPPAPACRAHVIYLDHHATTPIDPRVAQVVFKAMTEIFGNPNSVDHVYGEVAASAVDQARVAVARLAGAEPEDVRFTSGSSEALRLALAYAIERSSSVPLKAAIAPIEHPALLDAAYHAARDGHIQILWMEVDDKARVHVDTIGDALAQGAGLVCLMAANNEVGTLQPIEDAGRLAKAAGAAFLVDATQATGRMELHAERWGVDYLIMSGHKMYGPKGVGALVSPEIAEAPPPKLHPFRPATPNVPGIVGLGEAARLMTAEMATDEPRIRALRDRFETSLCNAIPGLTINGDRGRRLSNNLHISVPEVPNDAVISHLRNKVAISTGAACMSGADAPSHVLRAMNLPVWRQDGALRISLGKFNTDEDIEQAAEAIIAAVRAVHGALGSSP